MKSLYLLLVAFSWLACTPSAPTDTALGDQCPAIASDGVSLIVLGTIQDAGSPQIGCKKACCKDLFDHPDVRRQVVSLGLVDNVNHKKYLFEATPDVSRQMKLLVRSDVHNTNELVDGIFLTHAHIGHYVGLVYLGKEATDAKEVPVYAMPRMREFLTTNGPWSQLVSRKNIVLTPIEHETAVPLSPTITVTPFLVPHRDEYSETVGYHIKGPNKTALFIPDIDKWKKWDKDIVAEIRNVDYAFLDATFYSGKELNNRDMAQIPHPFVLESLEQFQVLSPQERQKVVFIHFNHTNPIINSNSPEAQQVLEQGFQIAQINGVFEL